MQEKPSMLTEQLIKETMGERNSSYHPLSFFYPRLTVLKSLTYNTVENFDETKTKFLRPPDSFRFHSFAIQHNILAKQCYND